MVTFLICCLEVLNNTRHAEIAEITRVIIRGFEIYEASFQAEELRFAG